MIQADEKHILFEGTRASMAQDYAGITEQMLKEEPEIACALFTVYSDELSKAILKCDTKRLFIIETIIKAYKEINNERH